jgi:hypothetical protein
MALLVCTFAKKDNHSAALLSVLQGFLYEQFGGKILNVVD